MDGGGEGALDNALVELDQDWLADVQSPQLTQEEHLSDVEPS